LLGTVPDRVVAEQAGVSLNAVRNYRVKKGIQAAHRRSSLSSLATSLTVPAINGPVAVPAPTGAQAWRVTISANGKERERVVVAESLVEAATRATSSTPDGRVTGIVWVAQIL
jgi:hypothetical protein